MRLFLCLSFLILLSSCQESYFFEYRIINESTFLLTVELEKNDGEIETYVVENDQRLTLGIVEEDGRNADEAFKSSRVPFKTIFVNTNDKLSADVCEDNLTSKECWEDEIDSDLEYHIFEKTLFKEDFN